MLNQEGRPNLTGSRGGSFFPENDKAEVPFKLSALSSLPQCFQPPAQGPTTAIPPPALWLWSRLEEAGARRGLAPPPMAFPPSGCCLHLIGQNRVTWHLSLQGRLGNVSYFIAVL